MAVIIPKMADYRSHDMLLRRSLHTGILFWARRVAAVLIFLLAVGAAVGASLLTPYFLAALTANILLLTISAVASFALFTGVGTKLALFCLGTGRRRLTATLSGLLTLIFLGWLYVLVLRPSASHFAEVVPYANTKYWELPTGSVIAYSEYDPPLGVAVKPDAIVYLHGGPGVRQAPFDQDLYGSLATNGFRVFLYDQAGSGSFGFSATSAGLHSRPFRRRFGSDQAKDWCRKDDSDGAFLGLHFGGELYGEVPEPCRQGSLSLPR